MFLKKIDPTPEQRKIFFLDPDEPVLLSGRAGSGKTTTAILRAAQLVKFYKRQGLNPRVGFFVFNNTLKTYLETLAKIELPSDVYDVWTLDYWCKDFLETRGLLPESIADEDECKDCLRKTIQSVGSVKQRLQLSILLGVDFLVDEVHYLLGRFGLDTATYINSKRIGRGTNPVITEPIKRAIAEEIVPNYQLNLESRGLINWSLLHDRVLISLRTESTFDRYDIVVVDEAQDLSALQIQIALELVSPQTGAITFIRDGTQRIYKANYIWDDIGLDFGNRTQLELEKNYRNTREIALVAASLMQGEDEDDDLIILDPNITVSAGAKPVWARGKYTHQQSYLEQRLSSIDAESETVGILHIQNDSIVRLSTKLKNYGYACTLLQQEHETEYPPYGIYLSTLHSAKGLEFDHIFIMGYDDFFAPGPHSLSHRETSAHMSAHRKLLYTAITRARKTLTITSSTGEYSPFLNEIDSSLLDVIDL